MSGCLICVFGISGVGKTTLVNRYVAKHPSWHALVASELLARRKQTEPDGLRHATRANVEGNQYLLADLIRAIRERNPSRDYLLDAHPIINNDIELIPVPVAAISRLEPTGLFFVHDDPAAIEQRRFADSRRRRPHTSHTTIATEQDIAFETCLMYSSALQVPLQRVLAGDLLGLAEALRHYESHETGKEKT